MNVFKPTETLMMMSSFAAMEGVHIAAYSHLLDTIGMPESEYSAFLSKEAKDVFKTAFELDQKWIVELGADRTPYVSQAQSINIFLPADVHKKELHQIHFQAWKKGLKSLYYCRSKSIQRAENVNNGLSTETTIAGTKEDQDNEECLSCQ